MSGFRPQLDPKTTFSQDPAVSLFIRKPPKDEKYVAQTFEVPFDTTPVYGESTLCTIPPKTDAIRRITVRSKLPKLYTPLGPGYVYPQYSDQVDGAVYGVSDTLLIQPGDFVGYFNTQQLNFWATNFTGYTISVAYDSSKNKFVFSSGTWSSIIFKNEGSASFWGFDIRTFDFITGNNYRGYNLTNGTLVSPLTLTQSGWIRGFTPPPPTGFSYKDSVATKLIKEARLLIGGQTIDRLTSERLYIEQDLSIPYENQAALTVLEGKNDTGGVYAPREYYTKLTFNLGDTLNIGQLDRHDVQVQVDFEKFENLPSKLITTNDITDPASYQNVDLINYAPLRGNRIRSTISYKNYLIITTSTIIYFYDTTKPINSAASYTPCTIPGVDIQRVPYISSGYFYFALNGASRLYRDLITDMLTGTANPQAGPTLSSIYGVSYPGTDVRTLAVDARYVYLNVTIQKLFSVNSNNCVLISTSPVGRDGLISFTATFLVPSISTPFLIPTDNAAFLTYLTNNTDNYNQYGATKTVTIQNETKVGSDVTVVGLVTYSKLVSIRNVQPFFFNPSVTLSGSNVATLVTTNPTPLYYSNIQCNLTFYNYPAISLSAGDQTALQTLVMNQTPLYGLYPGETRTYSLLSQIQVGSDIQVVSNVAYRYSNGQPVPHVFQLPFGYYDTYAWVRYDTTKSFSSAASYDFCTLPGSTNSSPLTMHDVSGYWSVSVNNFYPLSDGRYLYGSNPFTRTDTQNFLSTSSYSALTASLDPYPFLGAYYNTPSVSDGKYLYIAGTFGLAGTHYSEPDTFTVSRYNSTGSLNSQSSWEFLSISILNAGLVDAVAAIGFDGKNIYYCGGQLNTQLAIIRVDSVTFTLHDWIYYKNDGTYISSNGSGLANLNLIGNNMGGALNFNVGSRYLYVTSHDYIGGDLSNNFIQIDPLTMIPSFDASVLVKYEKYDQPRLFTKSLYGQTDVNEFTIRRGKITASFLLEFSGPVRELWISPDALMSRVTLRINNEIIIDDDAPVSRVIRAYESHANMPTGNLYMYNFSFDPERMEPSGTLNFSRTPYPTLEIKLVNPAVTDVTIRVYAKNFNVLETRGGMGGLAFSSTT